MDGDGLCLLGRAWRMYIVAFVSGANRGKVRIDGRWAFGVLIAVMFSAFLALA